MKNRYWLFSVVAYPDWEKGVTDFTSARSYVLIFMIFGSGTGGASLALILLALALLSSFRWVSGMAATFLLQFDRLGSVVVSEN